MQDISGINQAMPIPPSALVEMRQAQYICASCGEHMTGCNGRSYVCYGPHTVFDRIFAELGTGEAHKQDVKKALEAYGLDMSKNTCFKKCLQCGSTYLMANDNKPENSGNFYRRRRILDLFAVKTALKEGGLYD